MKKCISLLAILFLFSATPASATLAGEDFLALTPFIRVLGSNGTITSGVRLIPKDGGTQAFEDGMYTYHRYEMVYTTDGVNWKIGTLDSAPSKRSVHAYKATPEYHLDVRTDDEARTKSPDIAYGVYNGSEFLAYGESCQAPSYRSSDGIHWQTIQAADIGTLPTVSPYAVNPGPYRFELDALGEQLYLVAGDSAVPLEDVGQNRPESRQFTDVKAFYVPGASVRVELYTSNANAEAPAYVTEYKISSLNWVLKHKKHVPWTLTELTHVTHSTNLIRELAVGPNGTRWEHGSQASPDAPIQWNAIAAPWSSEKEYTTLYPWNGKSFLLLDRWSLQLYASEDGATWRCLNNTFLAPEAAISAKFYYPVYTSQHAITWTGTEYMACRRTVEIHYGMMGHSGANWHSPSCTKVYFADENFQKTGEYDFGRQVQAVGYQNGIYYAKVSRSAYLNVGFASTVYDKSGSHIEIQVPGYQMDTEEFDLYASMDKVNWAKSAQKPSAVSLLSLS